MQLLLHVAPARQQQPDHADMSTTQRSHERRPQGIRTHEMRVCSRNRRANAGWLQWAHDVDEPACSVAACQQQPHHICPTTGTRRPEWRDAHRCACIFEGTNAFLGSRSNVQAVPNGVQQRGHGTRIAQGAGHPEGGGADNRRFQTRNRSRPPLCDGTACGVLRARWRSVGDPTVGTAGGAGSCML